jgi:selenocysteine lyase/cysteine desulfurase
MSESTSRFSRRSFLRKSSALASLAVAGQVSVDELLPRAWLQLAESAPATQAEEERYWQLVKRQFFIEDGVSYLNTGTFGPTLRNVYEAANRNLFELGFNYNAAFRKNYLGDAVPKFIARLAEFVGARPDEIALTSGTTEAMNYIANGLDLKAGDEVLTTRHEHQGGIYPWLLKAKRYGIVVKQLDLQTPHHSHEELLEQFRAALTPRTRALSFCHINYTDGVLLPVKALCQLARERGINSVVDGAQSLGQLDFKLSELGCDFLAASWHKWMTGPYGTGLLFVRDEMRERLWPTITMSYDGWGTRDRDGLAIPPTNPVFGGGYPKALSKYSPNLEYYGALYWPLALAIDFHQLLGQARIERRIRALAEQAYRGLAAIPGAQLVSPATPELRTGLISFRAPGISTPDLFRQMSGERRIITRYIQHPGIKFDVSRVCTNIFNTPAEVDAAVAAVREKSKV